MRNQKFLRLLERRDCLLARDTREVFQKVGERVPALDVVNQSLERYASADEDRSAPEDLRIRMYNSPVVRHG